MSRRFAFAHRALLRGLIAVSVAVVERRLRKALAKRATAEGTTRGYK